MTVSILIGDVREQLRTLPDQSVNCVVTSPPYWGLRDYGVDGQIGLEATPAEFLATMTEVFREVRRVLRDDGTCWVNMGDSYCGGRRSSYDDSSPNKGDAGAVGIARPMTASRRRDDEPVPRSDVAIRGLKPKDLVGMPWRLAFALQADGWWLRQDIIWAKPNPMPESVRDRCTKAHEYIFLLSKSERYYFDAEAISEPAGDGARPTVKGWATSGEHTAVAWAQQNAQGAARNKRDSFKRATKEIGIPGQALTQHREARPGSEWDTSRRNKRSVWTITTKGFSEAHFATFPPELPETCIKAGCPPDGTVLDPFFGAGTTGLVADRLQRDCIGIELNPAYAEMARRRIQGDSPLFTEMA